jgi:hypothetical protein
MTLREVSQRSIRAAGGMGEERQVAQFLFRRRRILIEVAFKKAWF